MSSHSVPDTPDNTYTKDDIRQIIKSMGDRPIAFNRAYARITGSVEAGLMLAQGIHWSGQADKDGWFFRTQEKWEDDTTMSPAQQRTARKRLRAISHNDSPLWEEKEQGLPKQLFFKVNLDVLANLLSHNNKSSTIITSSSEEPSPLAVKNLHSIKKEDEKSDEMKDEMKSFSYGDEEKAPTVDEMFETFWQAYPKPQSTAGRSIKNQAKAKFRIALKKASVDDIMAGLEWWKKTDKWKSDGGKYIDGAQKWLNQEMWEAAKDQPTTVDKVRIGEQQSTDPEEAQREMMRQLEAMRRGA